MGDSTFETKILEAHNVHRVAHEAPPLELDQEISNFSQKWADTLLKTNVMVHSKNGKYGENIYWSSRKSVAGQEVVDAWYREVETENYKYGEPRTFLAGHFTQVVWKDSKHLGVGIASGPSGTFVVCNYEPRGNIIGSFDKNVLPPKHK